MEYGAADADCLCHFLFSGSAFLGVKKKIIAGIYGGSDGCFYIGCIEPVFHIPYPSTGGKQWVPVYPGEHQLVLRVLGGAFSGWIYYVLVRGRDMD